MIKFKGKINTEADEKTCFKALRQFMVENFQDFEFEVAGKVETLKDKQEKQKIEETPKVETKQTNQVVLG